MATEAAIRTALSQPNWAVVGCSPDSGRDSHRIAKLLFERGYEVIPVNPNCEELFGGRCYPTLKEAAASEQIDVVDLFRRSEAAGEHVREAVEIGAEAVWMQLGVIDYEAAEEAAAAGLTVVMDHCPAVEIPRLGIEGPRASADEA